MPSAVPSELLLIRHAPAAHDGRLCGRRDVPALLPPEAMLNALRRRLGPCRVVSSPALRCVQTAAALFPGIEVAKDARLWEQDFGMQEGMAFDDLPDLGPLGRADLAAHRPKGGESFADLAARVAPALEELAGGDGPVAVIAHAGTIRAALGIVLGAVEQGLAFEVRPLSLSRIRPGQGGAVICVNRIAD